MVWLVSLEATRRKAIEAGRFEAAVRSLELEGKALGFFEAERFELSTRASKLSTQEIVEQLRAQGVDVTLPATENPTEPKGAE